MRMRLLAAALLAGLPAAAGAELKFAAPDAFQVEHRFTIAAPVARAWESLVHPERWWPEDHTWSGKRSSLSLSPEAGGCYCERWDGGSAEHGRVIMAQPAHLLRLRASLGPLQELAVAGVLSITLAEKDGATTAVVTYRVSGDAAHKLDAFAAAVDQVIGLQFGGFAADAGK